MADTNSPGKIPRIRAAVYLILFSIVAAFFLATVERFTHQRIIDNERRERLKALQAILPEGQYDNEPHRDLIHVRSAQLLGSDERLPVYRARQNQSPAAAVLTVVAPNGFSGEIHLLVSIFADGEIAGVRVIRHQETPGLGDAIETRKSTWIEAFTGLRIGTLLADPQAGEWTLDRDGGSFDHISGATVTSRAVVKAVRNAVIYFDAHRTDIFSAPTEIESQD